MRFRKIGREEIRDFIEHPELVREIREGEFHVWQHYRGEWIRIVYIDEPLDLFVVTVMFPARRPRVADEN
jgi:hypothetical protein